MSVATDPAGPTTISIFNGETNRMNAYDAATFQKQRVVPSAADAPGGVGRDSNGQICFRRTPEGLFFIEGEDTNQGTTQDTAGWGYFRLTGTGVGNFQYEQVGKLIPTYQPSPDGGENYGCGFLRDGRLLTSDIGNQAGGPSNGQLIIWFPPFDTGAEHTPDGVLPVQPARYCKLDVALGTAGGIYIDDQDRVYVASARGTPGIYRYSGAFPTSDTAAGGCGRQDSTAAPLVDENRLQKERFIIPDLANVVTPNAIARSPKGTFYVSSVFNGVIAEYDANGTFLRRVLSPAPSDTTPPFATGTPLGIGVDSHGTLYYADIGIVTTGGIGPGPLRGSVRRIRFVDDQPQPPETIDSRLNFPDGIGILEQ